MKSIIGLFAALAALAGTARAENSDVPDFNAIRTPDSPAFVLLGVSPTQIERPNTPKQVAAALSGFLSEGGVAVPQNLAVEVAPFWLWSHPELTFAQYLDHGVGTQLVRNLSVSLATASTREVAIVDPMMAPFLQDNIALAAGVRTSAQLSREGIGGCGAELDQQIDLARRLSVQQEPDYAAAMARTTQADQQAALLAIKERIVNARMETAEQATTCLADGAADARGFTLELAAATSVAFAGSDPGEGELASTAAWATFAYKGQYASIVALARGRADEVSDGRDLLVEPGVRAIYARGRYALSAELVGRLRVSETELTEDRDSSYRVGLGFDLRLTDTTWLTVAFGKDFSGEDDGTLFSLANLKWGFGDPKVKGD